MYKKLIVSLIISFFSFFSCTQEEKKSHLNPTDYNQYLDGTKNTNYQGGEAECAFWNNKYESDTLQHLYLVKMAAAQQSLFNSSGKIEHLVKAGELLEKANKLTQFQSSSMLRSLARNYISQHRFQEALVSISIAEELGAELGATHKMMFDVHLELGNDEQALTYLQRLKNKTSFDYLIRLAKWEDHTGNLDRAIRFMEAAMAKAEDANDQARKQWSYTNLADFYGHAGRISDSYAYYLKALEIDPHNAYAKKGIAWISFSHERNPEEAIRILNAISPEYSAPDYHLLKAEIADFTGDENEKDRCISAYIREVENENYGNMYNAYNVELLSEELGEADIALKIAEKEVALRPTPQSYSLLAWALYHAGYPDKALSIIEEKVTGKSFEPTLLYQMAVIYKAHDLKEKVQPLKEELKGSIYELGPSYEQKIAVL